MIPDILFDDLLDKISSYKPNFNKKLIKKAYDFAKSAHDGQFRKSGEPYIIHPLYTAINLTKIQADEASIVAGLLHDVPEDTSYTLDDIRNEFGNEIAQIVDGVTKISKVHYNLDMTDYQVESLRKLFVSLSNDIRVIFVKICDRLHNLETLEYLPPHKRVRIAKETLEIYVPIINLLSIGQFMGVMDDLCFKYVYPNEYKQLYDKIGKNYDFYNEKIKKIKQKVLKLSKEKSINIQITGRIKSLYSIYNKIKQKDISIDMVYDIIALRVVTNDILDCYKMLGIIHLNFKFKDERFKDYISSPKNNGYQAIHTTVFDFDGDMVEFQIVTKEMDKLNKYGLAAHYIYKNFNQNYINTPDWVKQLLDIQKTSTDSANFYEKVKSEVLSPFIDTFTPKGKLIQLPIGATVLDFAYKVHTDLGNYFLGAYINGNYTSNPMKQLKKGDIVNIIKGNEINTSFNVEYISMVKTSVAKENLKKIFKNTSKEKRIKLGSYILNKKMEIFGLRHFEDVPFSIKDDVFATFKVGNIDDFFDMIGSGVIDSDSVIKILSKYYSKETDKKNVSLKIFIKTKDNKVLSNIIQLFKEKNVFIRKINYKKDYIIINFLVDNFNQFHELFMELKRMPNIKEIKRVFTLRFIVFNVLILVSMVLVLLNPIILSFLLNIAKSNDTYITNFLYLLTFGFMLLIIYLFKSIVKINLPDIFDANIFWIYMFLLDSIVLLTILWEMMFMKSYFNLMIFVIIGVAFYAVFIFEFVRHKIKKHNLNN